MQRELHGRFEQVGTCYSAIAMDSSSTDGQLKGNKAFNSVYMILHVYNAYTRLCMHDLCM